METATTWISVQSQERPTRHTEQVWCYDEKVGVTTGYYHGWPRSDGTWYDWWAEDSEHDLRAVTHWQPLNRPPPPQER